MNATNFAAILSLGLLNPLLGWQGESRKPYFPPPLVQCIALSRDGKTLAIVESTGIVRLRDLASGKDKRTLKIGDPGQVLIFSVVFAPNDKSLAIAGLKGRLEVWDVETGRLRMPFEGHRQNVWSVLFSKDGTTLYSAGNENDIRAWNVDTGKPNATIAAFKNGSITLLADDKTLAWGTYGPIKLWSLEYSKELSSFENDAPTYSLVSSPDGKTLLSTDASGGMFLWDLESRKKIRRYEGNKHAVSGAGFSPNGKLVMAQGYGAILIWDTATARLLATMPFPNGVLGCVFSPDGATLVGCDKKTGEIIKWVIAEVIK